MKSLGALLILRLQQLFSMLVSAKRCRQDNPPPQVFFLGGGGEFILQNSEKKKISYKKLRKIFLVNLISMIPPQNYNFNLKNDVVSFCVWPYWCSIGRYFLQFLYGQRRRSYLGSYLGA